MLSPDNNQKRIIDNLLRQGVTQDEIQKVYQSLRDKGYGEEEARRRSRIALERMQAIHDLEERRTQRPSSGGARAPSSGKTTGQQAPDMARRATDWAPEVPPWLRRQINRYAFQGGYLVTRLSERLDDILSHFDPTRPDYVNPVLLRLLADERGFRGRNPYYLSLIDDLDLLRDTASWLIGRPSPGRSGSEPGDALYRQIQAAEPFAVEFFSVFAGPQDALHKSLEYLGVSLRAHRRVRAGQLARVVRDGCRLVMITGAIERDKLETLFDVVREAHQSRGGGPKAVSRFAEAEGLFRAGFQNLSRYAHEMYPVLLKLIPAFYPEDDTSQEKVNAIRGVLGVKDGDLLTWAGWQKRMKELREKELRERQRRELERLEEEKAQRFSIKFEGTLTTLASLFPGSAIERIEQGAFIVPYFATRVFSRSPTLQARLADLEKISATDAMGVVIILHSLLDDMFSSIEPYVVEKIVGGDGLGTALVKLREEWRNAFPRVFEPYLDALREYEREGGGAAARGQPVRTNERLLSVEEKVNQLRARSIRGYVHVFTEREQFDGPKPHELAARLAELLSEVGRAVSQGTLAAEDPVGVRVMEQLAKHGIVDFVASTKVGTVDYHPVTRQIKRWIEARFRESVLDIPEKAQVGFVDVFRAVAYLYDAFLNDPRSPAAGTAVGITPASPTDRETWEREQASRGKDADPLLQAALMEQFPGQYADSLTGLRNKEYYLNELPRALQKLRARHLPLALLMIDIDHFKWINDSLGHPRGDEVLKATGAMLLDNIREGDIAVRYGGEELLVVATADLHTAIVLAERLRFAQESRVLANIGMLDVRRIAKENGQACGTLSIGVAEVGPVQDIAKAVEKADRALYAAKRTRNTVVLLSGGLKGEPEILRTYAEYRDDPGRSSAVSS
ncbi:MAG TPA: GGDEF domain-containing protein [Spirochaetia bacterium]